ncbi:MAG: RNA methyltransferase [Candidatus Pacebacteria bacterium]|nr:RNA methyltransferase [Candidatus Paceibacterota bacterium]
MPLKHLTLTSLKNPRVKHVVRLRNRRARDQHQQFIIEGFRPLQFALQTGYPINELYVCQANIQDNAFAQYVIHHCIDNDTPVVYVVPEVFRKMAYRENPEGMLALAPQNHRQLADIDTGACSLVIVAEAVEKPGNLGTILRSADATGVHALILCDQCTDLFNPNVVRASTGTLFTVPVPEATSGEAMDWLENNNFRVLAATPNSTTAYTDADMSMPTAIVIGTEHAGLSNRWLERADVKVRIPMHGRADSLNVATATTLLLYEALRQRQCLHRNE